MFLRRAELLGLWLMVSGSQASCSFICVSGLVWWAHWASLELLHMKVRRELSREVCSPPHLTQHALVARDHAPQGADFLCLLLVV